MLPLVFLLFGCGTLEKDIIGKWKIYNAEVIAKNLSEQHKAEAVEATKGFIYEFKEDGTVLLTGPYEFENKGKWKLNREVIDIEFEMPDDYWYGNSYRREVHLKINTSYANKMSLQETYASGESVIYYLERLD